MNILKQVKKERYYIQLRCEQIVEKIKKHKMEYIFHSSSSLDSFISNNKLKKNLKLLNKPQKIHVTLKKIYKKVVNREYHTIYELGNDLRNLWSYFFKLFADVPKLYRNIYIMNEYCEQLIHDIEKMSNIKLIQRNKNGITNLPFEDNSFQLIVFDPPHLTGAKETAWLVKKYGKLDETWPKMLHDGFEECMRVLKPDGVLIFKWSEYDIPAKKVWDAIGQKPLFGHHSGKKSRTFWACFMKLRELDG